MENGKIKAWLPAIRTGTGTDNYTVRLAQALERKGVICEISWFPLRYQVVPFLLQRVAAPVGTDIVFTNSWNGFAFKRCNVPLVVTVHHAEFDRYGSHLSPLQYIYRRALIRQYEMRSFHAANAITAVSQFTANTLGQTGFIDKIEVIQNWIDVNQFRPTDPPKNLNAPFRLLFVGKDSFLKGADLLPEIMERLGKGFHLSLAGRRKDQSGNRLPSNISALGWLDESELIHAYQDCDALLFPTRSEGFGYTALEAMACGKPVITSNATSLPEIIDNGVTGVLCAVGDSNDFAAAARQLAADPNRTLAMGHVARLKAVNEFSEDRVLTKYLNLIERLVHV